MSKCLAGQMIWNNYLERLGKQVLAIFILNGGMAAISLTCFAIKEMLSRRIEHGNPLLEHGHEPWPLWRQGLEELKFAVLYMVAYNVIFWVAYFPHDATRMTAMVPKRLVSKGLRTSSSVRSSK